MSRSLCVLVSHPPYGTLHAGEAIRHARGALAKGWDVVLAFLGESAETLLAGQSARADEWPCLSEAVSDLVDEGRDRAEVLVEHDALAALGLGAGDLVQGVRPARFPEIAQAMARCDRVLVF